MYKYSQICISVQITPVKWTKNTQIQNQIVIIEKVGIHFSLPIFHPQIDAQLIHYTARWMKTTIKLHNTFISKTNTPLQITLYSTCLKTHHGWLCQRHVTTYEQLWLINLLSSHAYPKLIYALNAFNNSSMFPSRWPLLVDFPSFHILNKKWARHKSYGVYLM